MKVNGTQLGRFEVARIAKAFDRVAREWADPDPPTHPPREQQRGPRPRVLRSEDGVPIDSSLTRGEVIQERTIVAYVGAFARLVAFLDVVLPKHMKTRAEIETALAPLARVRRRPGIDFPAVADLARFVHARRVFPRPGRPAPLDFASLWWLELFVERPGLLEQAASIGRLDQLLELARRRFETMKRRHERTVARCLHPPAPRFTL